MAVGSPDFNLNSYGIQYNEKRVNYTNKKNIKVSTAVEEDKEHAQWSKMSKPQSAKDRASKIPQNAAQTTGKAPLVKPESTGRSQTKQGKWLAPEKPGDIARRVGSEDAEGNVVGNPGSKNTLPRTSTRHEMDTDVVPGMNYLHSKEVPTHSGSSTPSIQNPPDTSSPITREGEGDDSKIVDLKEAKGTQLQQARGIGLDEFVTQEGGSSHSSKKPKMPGFKPKGGNATNEAILANQKKTPINPVPKGDKADPEVDRTPKRNPIEHKGISNKKPDGTPISKTNDIIMDMAIMKLNLMKDAQDGKGKGKPWNGNLDYGSPQTSATERSETNVSNYIDDYKGEEEPDGTTFEKLDEVGSHDDDEWHKSTTPKDRAAWVKNMTGKQPLKGAKFTPKIAKNSDEIIFKAISLKLDLMKALGGVEDDVSPDVSDKIDMTGTNPKKRITGHGVGTPIQETVKDPETGDKTITKRPRVKEEVTESTNVVPTSQKGKLNYDTSSMTTDDFDASAERTGFPIEGGKVEELGAGTDKEVKTKEQLEEADAEKWKNSEAGKAFHARQQAKKKRGKKIKAELTAMNEDMKALLKGKFDADKVHPENQEKLDYLKQRGIKGRISDKPCPGCHKQGGLVEAHVDGKWSGMGLNASQHTTHKKLDKPKETNGVIMTHENTHGEEICPGCDKNQDYKELKEDKGVDVANHIASSTGSKTKKIKI
jgi:hypothetical protein